MNFIGVGAANALGRAVRRPKIHLTDSGLAAVLLHTGQAHLKLADRLYVAPIDILWSG